MYRDNRIRILLANDHKIIREGLRVLFQTKTNEEIFEKENDKSILELAAEHKPDIVIIDIVMSEQDSIELSRQILSVNENIRILAHAERIHLHLINEAIKAGITGFVLKECGFDILYKAVETLYNGETYMCPKVKDILARSYFNKIKLNNPYDTDLLNEKDYELIRLLSHGMTTKEIALRMDISSKTVDAHRRNVMEKLNFDNYTELIKHAIRIGLISV